MDISGSKICICFNFDIISSIKFFSKFIEVYKKTMSKNIKLFLLRIPINSNEKTVLLSFYDQDDIIDIVSFCKSKKDCKKIQANILFNNVCRWMYCLLREIKKYPFQFL